MFTVNVGKAAACGSQPFQQISIGRVEQGCNLLALRPDGTPNWSYAGGTFYQGLQNRRQAERKLCREDLQ